MGKSKGEGERGRKFHGVNWVSAITYSEETEREGLSPALPRRTGNRSGAIRGMFRWEKGVPDF